jgi:hypothetical protein
MNTKDINSKLTMTLGASPCIIRHNACRSLLIIDYIDSSKTWSVFVDLGTCHFCYVDNKIPCNSSATELARERKANVNFSYV